MFIGSLNGDTSDCVAMVPTTMPSAATTGLQVQLGDDEEREARRAARNAALLERRA